MFDWKKNTLPALAKNTRTLPAPQAADDLRRRLIRDFALARKGTHCRTRAFKMPHDEAGALGREWLTAAEDPADGTWFILCVQEEVNMTSGDVPIGDWIETSEPRKSGLTLFAMIEYLATYEISRASGMALLDGAAENTPEALGAGYYKDLALREGIGFDNIGMPHPTLHGRIVTPGSFPPGMEEKLRAAMQLPPAAPKEKTFLPVLKTPFDEAGHRTLMDAYLESRAAAEPFGVFVRRLEGMWTTASVYYGEKYRDIGYPTDTLCEMMGVDPNDMQMTKHKKLLISALPFTKRFQDSVACFNWLQRQCRADAKQFGPASQEFFETLLDRLALYFEMYRGRAYKRICLSTADPATQKDMKSRLDDALKEMIARTKTMNLTEAQIVALKTLAFCPDSEFQKPAEIEDMLTQCREMLAATMQKTNALKEKLEGPQP